MSRFHQTIRDAIAKKLSSGQPFKIIAEPTGIGSAEVVRVITPAWRKHNRMDRVMRVQDAVLPLLSAKDRKRVFRFSVLTDDEWKDLRKYHVGSKPKVVARRS